MWHKLKDARPHYSVLAKVHAVMCSRSYLGKLREKSSVLSSRLKIYHNGARETSSSLNAMLKF